MSSSDRNQRGEGQRSLSKFIRRTSKIIRPREADPASDESAPSASSTTPAAAPAGPSTAAPAAASTAAPTRLTPAAAGMTIARARSPVAPPVPPKEAAKTSVARRPVPRQSSSDAGQNVVRATPLNADQHYRLQEQKARALFAKYNLTLEDGEWQRTHRSADAAWVEQKPRIRVHRQCHRCQTGFGRDKVCQQCQHTRCKKCPRFPDKSLRDHTKVPFTIAVDTDPQFQPTAPRISHKTLVKENRPGQDLVRKHPTHRVRRFCHRCETLFVGQAKLCANCNHLRCPKCPREPPKEKKYPNGYPGDTPETFPLAERRFRQVRQRVRWECEQCKTFFLEHQRECRTCQHQRCDGCTRTPPKKIKSEPHPDVISSLQAKLGGLQVSAAA